MITQMELESSIGHMTKYPAYAQNALDRFLISISEHGLVITRVDCLRPGFITYYATKEKQNDQYNV